MTDPSPTRPAAASRLTNATGTAIVVLLSVGIALRPAVDNDLWWHLRSGQWMVVHHRLLGPDPFSYTTHGASRVPYDWLSQIGLYGTYRLGGLVAVSILTSALAGLGMFLVATACRPKTDFRVAVLVLVALASAVFWSARPQMTTFVITAAVVAALANERRGRRVLWWLVPAFALWTNLHLGWFYGLGILWVTTLGWWLDRRLRRDDVAPELIRRTAAVSLACSLAVFVQPAATRLPRLVLTQASVGQRFILEDQPPSWHQAEAVPFFVLLTIAVVVLGASWKRLCITEAALVGGTAIAGLTVIRLVPLFATVAAPPVCRHGSALMRKLSSRPTARGAADKNLGRAAVALTAVGVVIIGMVRLRPASVQARLRQEAPVGATQWLLQNHPPGRLWTTFDWGGWFIWKTPGYPVWIDGRADLHEAELTTFASLEQGHGWQRVFEGDGVRVAIVDTNRPLAESIGRDRAWRVAYRDPLATVFVRR